MESLRPNDLRAKNTMTFIWIVFILEFAALISGYFQYDLLQTVAEGGEISTEKANANDTREQVIAFAYLFIYLISAVTFIKWFRRAYFNLHLRVDNLSFNEGWAAGSWFFPIVNLYRPYQIMKELYRETKKFLRTKGLYKETSLDSGFLGWWWFLWITNGIAGQIIFRLSLRAESIDELTTVTVLSMIGSVLGLPLALITIKVIKDYSAAETLLNDMKVPEVYPVQPAEI